MTAQLNEHGDSGGPDFLRGTHTIVAVNSAATATYDILARVNLDVVENFIKARVNAHGGFKNGGGFVSN